MIYDSHFHIIDNHYPLVENNGYLPNEFNSSDYLKSVESYNVIGGAIVSGSFQVFDQEYLLNALTELGTNYVGVTQIPANTTDDEIFRLNKAGVRAVRFNLRRGGSAGIEDLERLALRVHELVNWHVELYVDTQFLDEIYNRLLTLPKIVIDHLGLSKSGLPKLLKMVEKGAFVKATGFGRIDFNPVEAIKSIVSANDQSLMFGTDLPSTRAPRPFSPSDIDIIRTSLTQQQAQNVLYNNAIRLYKPSGL